MIWYRHNISHVWLFLQKGSLLRRSCHTFISYDSICLWQLVTPFHSCHRWPRSSQHHSWNDDQDEGGEYIKLTACLPCPYPTLPYSWTVLFFRTLSVRVRWSDRSLSTSMSSQACLFLTILAWWWICSNWQCPVVLVRRAGRCCLLCCLAWVQLIHRWLPPFSNTFFFKYTSHMCIFVLKLITYSSWQLGLLGQFVSFPIWPFPANYGDSDRTLSSFDHTVFASCCCTVRLWI